jgi:quercetin dioxygenase-like cupin family protein
MNYDSSYPLGARDPASLGEAFWMGGSLVLIRVPSAATGGQFLVTESFSPPGHGPATQRFPGEDRIYYVIEGELTFKVADDVFAAGPGSVVHVPAGTPHTYRVDSAEPARWLLTSSPGRQWENYIRAISTPATQLTLTPPTVELLPMEIIRRIVIANGFEVAGPRLPGASRMGSGVVDEAAEH